MKPPLRSLRWLVIVAAALGSLAGCVKKTLPETVVHASTARELAAFRADLAGQFGTAELPPFDTAIQELKLQAMIQGVAGTEARERQMQAAVHGKTVREALILGWQARRARLLGEIAEITTLLERDRRMQKRAATAAAAQSAGDRIKSEQDILTRLQGDLADAEQHLIGWGATAPPAAPKKSAEQPATGRAP